MQATLGFVTSPSQSFTIINNDKSDPVTGTFRGLVQNATFHIGGELFQISYTGGLGANDVVLTRLVTPPPPALRIERLSPGFVRLTWPTNAPHFVLQANTNLNTASWGTVTPAPSVIDANYSVTNTVTGLQKSYRLFSP